MTGSRAVLRPAWVTILSALFLLLDAPAVDAQRAVGHQRHHFGCETLHGRDLLLQGSVPQGGANPVDALGEKQSGAHRRGGATKETHLHDRALSAHHFQVAIHFVPTNHVKNHINAIGHSSTQL